MPRVTEQVVPIERVDQREVPTPQVATEVEAHRLQTIERTSEVPKNKKEEDITKIPKVTTTVIDPIEQNQNRTIEVKKPEILQNIVQRKKPHIHDENRHAPKVMKQVALSESLVEGEVPIPQVQTIDEDGEVPVHQQVDVPKASKVQKGAEVPQEDIDPNVHIPAITAALLDITTRFVEFERGLDEMLLRVVTEAIRGLADRVGALERMARTAAPKLYSALAHS